MPVNTKPSRVNSHTYRLADYMVTEQGLEPTGDHTTIYFVRGSRIEAEN